MKDLSPVIMGCWQAGRQYWTGVEDHQIIEAVNAALDAGVTTFDTAEEYGDGHSERILGKALGKKRSEAVICTKVFSDHLRAQQVIDACHQSLKNLETDYVDLYQIHWPSGSWGGEPAEINETMGTLIRLKEQGKILRIGVSNFNLAQLKEAADCGPIFSLQPPYSLFWCHIDTEIRPYCEANNIHILAYSPLGQGVLTGRFAPGHSFDPEDNRRDNLLFQPPHIHRAHEALEALKPIAERLSLSLAQLAIAWVTAQKRTHAVAGARNAQQITETAAGNVTLSSQDLQEITRIGETVSGPLMDQIIPWNWEP